MELHQTYLHGGAVIEFQHVDNMIIFISIIFCVFSCSQRKNIDKPDVQLQPSKDMGHLQWAPQENDDGQGHHAQTYIPCKIQ